MLNFKILKILLLIFLFSLNSFLLADNKNKITWQTIHWPPFMSIENGKTSGEYSKLLNLIESQLPQYVHKRQEMAWSRIWKMIKVGKQSCNIFAFKNKEREKFTEFTIPFSIFASNHIIMKESKAKFLGINNKKSISIEELIQKKSIKTILDKSRSYSSTIDNILTTDSSKVNFTRRAFTAKRLLKMLSANRIDYMIEYPSIIKHLQKSVAKKEKLISIPIKEIAPFTWGYIACPKNQWGKDLVDSLNVVISKNRPNKEYRDIIEMMTSSKRELKSVRKIYPDFINSKK